MGMNSLTPSGRVTHGEDVHERHLTTVSYKEPVQTFQKIPGNGLVADTSSETGGHGLHIRRSY